MWFEIRFRLACKGGLTSSCELKPYCERDWISCAHTREVVSPKRPDLILSTDIPNIETCVLVRDGLDVEADGGNGVDFACGARRELEGVEDSFKRILSAVGSSTFCASSHQEQLQHEACASRCNMPPIQLAEKQTYWSFRRHRDQASTGAFPCCRRSWPGSERVRRPWCIVLLWCVVVVAITV